MDTRNAPRKPGFSDFPLTAHNNDRWCKKIKGKFWLFGVVTDAKVANYLAERDEIQAGMEPRLGTTPARVSPGEFTVAEVCNLFLSRQEERSQRGEITRQYFNDCVKACQRLVGQFGRYHRAASMQPADFAEYKAPFPQSWGVEMASGHIQKIRSVFRWAAEAGILPTMPVFGVDFRKPNATTKRRERQKRQAMRGGRLDFTAAEAKLLVDGSDGWLRACILLGLNAEFLRGGFRLVRSATGIKGASRDASRCGLKLQRQSGRLCGNARLRRMAVMTSCFSSRVAGCS